MHVVQLRITLGKLAFEVYELCKQCTVVEWLVLLIVPTACVHLHTLQMLAAGLPAK